MAPKNQHQPSASVYTFIDVRTGAAPEQAAPVIPVRALSKSASRVPLAPDEQRLIIATCEKGTVEDVTEMREIKLGLDALPPGPSQLRGDLGA